MRVFNLPDLGEGLQEAEIVEWHVAPGDAVAADRTMVSVETDKAIVEIPAPYAGTIEKLFAQPGETVRVGAPLVGFSGAAEDRGAVVGELQAAAPPSPLRAAPSSGVKATPAVRALARRLGVAIERVAPSGPEGVVTAQDVQRAAEAHAPLHGTRRAMAKRLAAAHAEVAAVTVMDDADVDAWSEGTGIMPRLVRAVVAACRAEPALNAWYEASAEARRVLQEVHIGIAVDTPAGLLVPVLRDCHARAAAELGVALEALIRSAHERTLAPEALRGATILLSNYGAIAGRYASPMVVPPAVAIVGAGRVAPQPVVVDGRVLAHRVLPLSLTFDHRAVTGGEAARFLRALIDDLERGA